MGNGCVRAHAVFDTALATISLITVFITVTQSSLRCSPESWCQGLLDCKQKCRKPEGEKKKKKKKKKRKRKSKQKRKQPLERTEQKPVQRSFCAVRGEKFHSDCTPHSCFIITYLSHAVDFVNTDNVVDSLAGAVASKTTRTDNKNNSNFTTRDNFHNCSVTAWVVLEKRKRKENHN